MFGDRKIFQTVLSLGFENVVRILLSALASIVVSRYLGPESFGKYTYIMSVVLIFSPIINFSMNEVVVKKLVEKSLDEQSIFNTGFFLRGLLGLLGVVFCLLYCFYQEGVGIVFYLVSVYALFFFLKSFDIIEYFFIAKERIKEIAKRRTLIFICMNTLKVVFVFMERDWKWFVYISALEIFLVFILYIWKSFKEPWFEFNANISGSLMVELFKESSPFFLITLMTILFIRVDHILIWEYLGNKQLGEYSIVVKWGELLNFLPLLLTSAFLPRIIEESKEARKPLALKNFFRLNLMASILITMFFLFLGPTFIKVLYGESYQLAPGLIRIYSFQICLSFLYVALVRYLLVLERMKSAAFLYTLALILNISINLILIPRFGLVGAIVSSISAYILSLVTTMILDKEVKVGALTYLRSLL